MVVKLSKKMWVVAHIIGALREKSIALHRKALSDRGSKNREVDIGGAIGELVLIKRCEEMPEVISYTHNIFKFFGQSLDNADVIAVTKEKTYFLDAKSLLLNDNKRLFLVNKKAHENAVTRKTDGIVPVISRMNGDVAYVGKYIPLSDVGDWEIIRFKNYENNPSYCMDLHTFVERYMGENIKVEEDYFNVPEIKDNLVTKYLREEKGREYSGMSYSAIISHFSDYFFPELIPVMKTQLNLW